MGDEKYSKQRFEMIKDAPPETYSLTITRNECFLVRNALDLYSRIWIGQYGRIDDICIYETGDMWNTCSEKNILFQKIRDKLIPSLVGYGNYLSCSLGIWSEKTSIKAINAYDIQQRLRYEVSWFEHPEGDITVDYDTPYIRGNIGDFSVFCEKNGEDISVYLYLSLEQLLTINTSLEVYRLIVDREIKDAFIYFTYDEDALGFAEELTKVYKRFDYKSLENNQDFGKKIYREMMEEFTILDDKISNVINKKDYAKNIRINIPPANEFLPSEDIMKIINQPFEHFKKHKGKFLPKNVLELPGAGFLTKMSRKEHSTTDYLLVWYVAENRTEYYYAGEDYYFKHKGKLDLPEDVRKYILNKTRKRR